MRTFVICVCHELLHTILLVDASFVVGAVLRNQKYGILEVFHGRALRVDEVPVENIELKSDIVMVVFTLIRDPGFFVLSTLPCRRRGKS